MAVTAAALLLTACASAGEEGGSASGPADDETALADRLTQIEDAVETWIASSTITEAHAAAEAAANLVVGPNGPGYGDRDGDGAIRGDTDLGLLPGLDGTPDGIAFTAAANPCVEGDVLGGSWDDPAAAWEQMLVAVDEWEPANNTMPTLASHPMRIVGWSTFTIESDSLDDAHEYGGHAQLHVAVSMSALDC